MKNFYFAQFMSMAAVAAVVLTSCSKDKKAAELTPDSFKHVNQLVSSGRYGSVKTMTTIAHYDVKIGSDSASVDYSAAKPQSKTVTEFSVAGYVTSIKTERVSQTYNFDKGGYDYGTEYQLYSETVYTRDEKNRETKRERKYYQNDTVDRASSEVTTYEYNEAAKKVTVTIKTMLGVDRSKYVYDLDDDGYMDNSNYERYDRSVVTTAFNPKPAEVYRNTVLAKDPKGNPTEVTLLSLYKYSSGAYVQVEYTKYEYVYY